MTNGSILWLRQHRVIQSTLIAALASSIVYALLALINPDGGGIEVAPLWRGACIALPLLFMFNRESAVEVVAPRSMLGRRLVLVLLAIAVSGVLSLFALPDGFAELGVLATWRDALALLGLGLLSLAIVPPAALWVVPMVATLSSMLFAWPLHPSIWHGVWGALRAPAGIQMNGGAPNVSIPVCLLILAAGAVGHLKGSHNRTVDQSTRRSRQTVGPQQSNDPAMSWPRPSLITALTVLVVAVSTLASLSSLPWWGGSPRLFLAQTVPHTQFIHATLGATVGVVIGQSRWRTGVAVWQDLSPRSTWSLVGATGGRAASTAAIAVGTPVLLCALLATLDVATHAGFEVAAQELLGGVTPAIAVLATTALAAALGAGIGWLISAIWMPVLVLVLTLALLIAVPPQGQEVDRQWAERYGYTECMRMPGRAVTVCTALPNQGYLRAAITTLTQIYDSSPRPDVLPRRIHLGNQGTLGVIGPQDSGFLPVLGVAPNRGFTPPSNLNRGAVDSLSYSTNAWCPGTNLFDLRILFGQDPERSTPTMAATVAALARCQG